MECESCATSRLSDADLAAEVTRLAGLERKATARLVAALAEFDARRLYLPAGCSSMFTYCTQVLHLSEHAAYNRIEAARAARRYPALVDRLFAGDLTLTAVRLLSPHLNDSNHQELFAAARHKSKCEIEQLIAQCWPRPDVPATIRKLPATATDNPPVTDPELRLEMATTTQARSANPLDVPSQPPHRPLAPARLSVVVPLAPERYKLQFTISSDTHDKLRRAQELLRNNVPIGDLAAIFDRAITVLLSEVEKRKMGAVQRFGSTEPRGRVASNRSRYIESAVRRQVWARDEGRCAFVGTAGRCAERSLLEFHHLIPYADGGENTVENLELRCRRHNQYEADLWSGTLSE
jgi:hypothetical protein